MPSDAKPNLTPKLRFPEFQGHEGWSESPLQNSLRIPATYGIVTAGNFQSKGIPMIRGGDIKDGRIGSGLPLVSEEIHAQYKRTTLQTGDVVIALVGYPGEAAVVPQCYVGANISRAVGLLRVASSLEASFLTAYLNSPWGRATVLKPSAGSAQVVVNLKHLNEIKVPVPKRPEQQKIAECLSTLDELIGAENQKLDALKAHKKGLMQQLFPREGETRPRLRFPEFQNASEWRGRRLDDVLESITNGLSVPQNGGVDGFRVTRIETISSQVIDLTKVGFISTDQDISSYKLQIGDILLSNINSVSHIGKTAFVSQEYDLYHGMNLLRLIVNKAENHPLFIYYLLNTDGVRESFRARANKAVNQASINQTELGRTAITLPKKEEQHRIATCLSSLDDLIAAQSDKLEALKTHKRGLMQQLFPSPTEAAA